jgi:hypothetical protein
VTLAGSVGRDEILLGPAVAAYQGGRVEESYALFRRQIALTPSSFAAQHSTAHVAYGLGNYVAARRHASRAQALAPDQAMSLSILGLARAATGERRAALVAALRSAALMPGSFEVLNNLGIVANDTKSATPSTRWFTRAIASRAEAVAARWNRANVHLLCGRWTKAWHDFDLRLIVQDSYPHRLERPRWGGQVASDGRLLVHDEIGYGDVFNFIRFLPLARRRVGELLFEVKPELMRVLARCRGVDRLLCRGDEAISTESFDWVVPLESLPGIFGTTPDTVPPADLLEVDDALTAEWARKLSRVRSPRLGLVWAGSATSGFDRNRSMDLADLLPVVARLDAEFVSLQKGPAADRISHLRSLRPVWDLGADLSDFADTAAVIANLDGVVTVETAVAHLAGVLRKPTWVLLCHRPAWRWLLGRDGTPWYPSVRLYRQETAGDWRSPVDRLGRDLEEWLPMRRHG